MKNGFIYKKENTNEIMFPLGGIGTGSIGLGGNGRLEDWEIFNRPAKGSSNGMSHIAVKALKKDGTHTTKILQGDLTKEYMGRLQQTEYSGFGYGPSGSTFAGFPHFKEHSFEAKFPFAELNFSDDNFPADVRLTAFNPFIPLDSDNSGIPAAFFEVKFANNSDEDIEFAAALSVCNHFKKIAQNKYFKKRNLHLIKLGCTDIDESDTAYGDMCIASDATDCAYQEYWYNGLWSDPVLRFFREFDECERLKNHPERENMEKRIDTETASVAAYINVPSHESRTVKFVLSWSFPNNYNYWNPYKIDGKDVIWKNYYATKFGSSLESAEYALKNWDSLYERSRKFSDAIHNVTMPDTVKEAAISNLCVLKSPTVLRLQDGSFYGWEGVHQLSGSCEGNCQHVWNYAYALPYLFPNLERSIRELEYKYNQWEDGHLNFRLNIPLGREKLEFSRPCVDGQLGGIIKVYREWKISGDDEWLRSVWPAAKRSLEYCWDKNSAFKWDPDKTGVITGRQHHTLDMDMFGPSSWLEGFYLAALKAAAEIAEHLGETDNAKEYLEMFKKGKAFTDKELFNGEYYYHKIDLTDKNLVLGYGEDELCLKDYWDEETKQIKYQVGNGCIIDQVLAQWHANLVGIGEIYDKEQLKTALKSIYKYNFKPSLREVFNPYRTFAFNDEGGTLICTYPDKENVPAFPITYCEECMTGFEYAVAGLLLQEGMQDEALDIITAVRDRYDGAKRNPFNELECGSNYARSMASFAFMNIYSGFNYDATKNTLKFAPIVDGSFTGFWSTAGAYGTVKMGQNSCSVEMLEGELILKEIEVCFVAKTISIDGEILDADFGDSVKLAHPYNVTKYLHIG